MNERRVLRGQFQGTQSHVGCLAALEGLAPELAGRHVQGAPSTIYQVLEHMSYWQDITLARLRGERVEPPKSAALGWQTPEAPLDARAWEAAVERFSAGLRAFETLVESPALDLDARPDPLREPCAREELLMIQGHNSYHLGQIVLLRQMIGSWPPPQGGSTW